MCLYLLNFYSMLIMYSFNFLYLGSAYFLLSLISKSCLFLFPLVNGIYSSVNRERYREVLSSAIHPSSSYLPQQKGHGLIVCLLPDQKGSNYSLQNSGICLCFRNAKRQLYTLVKGRKPTIGRF